MFDAGDDAIVKEGLHRETLLLETFRKGLP